MYAHVSTTEDTLYQEVPKQMRQTIAPGSTITPLRAGLAYLVIIAAGNLVWEVAHAPLYTIWIEASFREIAFAIIHCTLGDIAIAAASLAFGWMLFGRRHWPQQRWFSVAIAAILIGVGYTVFSEWLNISVRGSWAYRDIMPTLGPLNTGLSPLLQWLVSPTLAFVWVKRATV